MAASCISGVPVAFMKPTPLTWHSLLGQLRFFVCVLLNTLVAVFLPATLQSEFHPSRFFPYSGIGLLSAPWTTSVIFAALCGLVAARLESRTAGWSWLVPAGVFVCAAWFYLGRHRLGLITGNTGFFSHFSGYGCAHGLQKSECQDRWVFTVPLVGSISYSATAPVVLRLSTGRQEVRGGIV